MPAVMCTEKYLSGPHLRIAPVRDFVDGIAPGRFESLTLTARILAENLVRRGGGVNLEGYARQVIEGRHDEDIPFFPARVVLQDLLGTPALVDLAGLREAVAQAGGDPLQVNPAVPTQLVVDHSLTVEVAGSVADALARNMTVESRRNAERFAFLSWAKHAFRNLDIVMPGNGILHQVNLERMSPVVQVQNGLAFADTLVGTDSHTTMINALGVLGWGVGGIEAESVMLGRPIWMRLPEIVGVEISGTRQAGVQATDLVLALTEYLRREGVVGCILEFCGDGVTQLSLADRATVSNMGPEFGATAAMFAIDDRTLEFLRLTGRSAEQVQIVREYAREQGLWASTLQRTVYRRRLHFDLSTAGRAIAGPAQPHQRIPLNELKTRALARAPEGSASPQAGQSLQEGAVVIAAITSCTNTSNPRNMIAAGLVARKAASLGLKCKPWVKTSLAPGSRAVEIYLREAGLLSSLEALGFGIVGFGCTSCNGMSGPLPPEIESQIRDRQLRAVAVISGNRNFNGRIHPWVKDTYLASPALVVAYAIAGTIHIDIEADSLGDDPSGGPVRLADLWPPDEAIDRVLADSVRGEQFAAVYEPMFARPFADDTKPDGPPFYAWQTGSTYIRCPPYWDPELRSPPVGHDMRPIAILGDDVTTDDLSPSGAILPDSAAGKFLIAQGVPPPEFNSYGTRRGNHVVAVRATLANPRLKNEMLPDVEGSFTRVQPEGVVMPIFDAAEVYLERKQELIIVAGRNYGSGSSRDWAAKGIRLLGVRAVIAESFERIHRANLVGVGVLPLEFEPGITRKTLGLDGSELFTLADRDGGPQPGSWMTLRIRHADGHLTETRLKCRIETAEESLVFAAGGILPRMAEQLRCARPGTSSATRNVTCRP